MSRVRRGFKARQRRNKILKMAKGFHFDRRRKFKHTAATVKRALHNAFKGRKLLKRNMRRLWIVRINASVRLLGSSYSRFMDSLKKAGIVLDRKSLSEMAIRDFKGFETLYQKAQKPSQN
jgi:large subunit ribosomal protein L20